MPLYDYKCKSCEHEFSQWLKSQENKLPESMPCPQCGESEVQQVLGATAMSYRGATKTVSDDFNYRVKEMKKRYGKSETQLDGITKN